MMNFKKNRRTEHEAALALQHPDYRSELVEIIRSNLAPKLLREKLLGYHENDVAAALEFLKKEERSRLYTILDPDSLADILEYTDERDIYIGEMGIRRQVDILSRLEAGTASEYLKRVGRQERNAVLELMEEEERREILLLSSFDEDELGSRMTTNFVSVKAGIGVRQAMRELIDQAAEHDNISTIYVIDERGIFAGAIDLKDLIIAREGTPLDSVTRTSYPYVYVHEQIEACIERLREYSEDSIPVLDGENRLRGVLTAQDIADLTGETMGEDYARLGGLTAEEDLQEPLRKSIGKRLPWLIILLGLGLVVSSVVGLFEGVVSAIPLVICFQSLILDMAGNTGTQSLAVTIRVLMDEGLTGRERLSLVSKEARVALSNGLILGTMSFLCIGAYLWLLKGEAPGLAFAVSACTGLALLAAMFLSGITGTLIPLLFKQMKIDPAVASGPLITTVNDLVAVVAYYGLVWALLL